MDGSGEQVADCARKAALHKLFSMAYIQYTCYAGYDTQFLTAEGADRWVKKKMKRRVNSTESCFMSNSPF
jgi:hypothetical protein